MSTEYDKLEDVRKEADELNARELMETSSHRTLENLAEAFIRKRIETSSFMESKKVEAINALMSKVDTLYPDKLMELITLLNDASGGDFDRLIGRTENGRGGNNFGSTTNVAFLGINNAERSAPGNSPASFKNDEKVLMSAIDNILQIAETVVYTEREDTKTQGTVIDHSSEDVDE